MSAGNIVTRGAPGAPRKEKQMIDLRSDTVTRPTPAMREAMAKAPVGDDAYGDDPTVNELEALAADVTGMEAALFVCSGTMGNQLAIMTHTRPGDEIISALQSHVIQHEAGAYARLSGVSAMTADGETGGVTARDVVRLCREPDNLQHPVTRLVCLENAQSDGRVAPLRQTRDTVREAHARGLLVHLDGARLFNAAAALGVSAAEVVAGVDSVMFCLSKGLCAPVGSLLCGTRAFVAKARRNRKVLGGNLRQAGVLAACGLLAIREMAARLPEDHANAKALARALSELPGVSVDPESLQINMVFARVSLPGFSDAAFVSRLTEKGVLINGAPDGHYRFVTHRDVSAEDVQRAAQRIAECLA